jgi:hypothetical protein
MQARSPPPLKKGIFRAKTAFFQDYLQNSRFHQTRFMV